MSKHSQPLTPYLEFITLLTHPFIDPAKLHLAFRLIEKLTKNIWTRLGYSKDYEISHGERTITDITLLDLRMEIDRLKIHGMDVWKCNEAWEPQIGIDWMWYIGSPRHGWLRFAVQSKKLNLDTLVYDSLRHQIRPGLMQDKVLEGFANWAQATPLYSLYNYVELEKLMPEWCVVPPEGCRCLITSYWHCCKDFDREQFGCTMVPLDAVRWALEPPGAPYKRHNPSRRRFNFLHDEGGAVPWRCLLCRNYMTINILPTGILSHPQFGEMQITTDAPEGMLARLGDIMDLGNRDDIDELMGMTVGPWMIIRIDVDQLGNPNLNPPEFLEG